MGEAANAHRKVGNLFDVKLRAIENCHAAGIDVCLVVTVVNTVNNDQVGAIVKFALENCDKISFVSFQPVSFTGRDEDISDEERHAKRYTLSHLAEDLKSTDGRDRAAPRLVSAVGLELAVRRHRPGAGTGRGLGHAEVRLSSGLRHRDGVHGQQAHARVGAARRVRQRRAVPEGCPHDRRQRARARADQAAVGAEPSAELHARRRRRADFDSSTCSRSTTSRAAVISAAGSARSENGDRKQDEWLLMFVAGMWFQDLWTYDFRRTEMCIIPYATQMGEISFCAYNTGVGWRQIVEKMHQNASVAEWYKEHGKHAVYANPRKAVPLDANAQPISLRIPRDGRLVDWQPSRQTARPGLEELVGVERG